MVQANELRAPLNLDEVHRLGLMLTRYLGLRFEENSLEQLSDVVFHRLKETGCHTLERYVALLEQPTEAKKELRVLSERLTIGETYFFRHQDQCQAFIEVAVPERIAKQPPNVPIRILSAGCSSGEEAYTLAILLQESGLTSKYRFSIVAIDINSASLRKATEAKYTEWSFRDTPPELKKSYFRPEGKQFQLLENIQNRVTFLECNLAEENPQFWCPQQFDVIFCRNVIMYFSSEILSAVLARMTQSLLPGGYLFLGPSETLRGISQDFHLCHTHNTFYYQRRENELNLSPRPRVIAPQESLSQEPVVLDGTWVDVISNSSENISRLLKTVRDSQAANKKTRLETPSLEAITNLMREERFDEAMQLLQHLPSGEVSADAKLLRAVILTNQGRVAEAELVCREILKVDELNAGAHYLKALLKEHAGDRRSAIEQDQIALYLDPTFAMPHLHWGLMAKRNGEYDAALRHLSQAEALLLREDGARILLFGGGFSREALINLCQAELRACEISHG